MIEVAIYTMTVIVAAVLVLTIRADIRLDRALKREVNEAIQRSRCQSRKTRSAIMRKLAIDLRAINEGSVRARRVRRKWRRNR